MIRKIKGLLAMVLSLCIVVSVTAFAAPSAPTDIAAVSAILMEKTTGNVLYEKDADKKIYPASMTKVLTSLILMDYFKPEDIITVGDEINDISLDSSKAGHVVGEQITAENLIRGLMIPSGNDSAAVVAASVVKKKENNNNLSSDECIAEFAKIMNEKAKELGCTNSHFANPHGYHNENHYTTARDMSLIVSAAMDNEIISEIAAEKSFSGNSLGNLKDQHPDAITNEYNWKSHNLLIAAGSEYNYEYATGFKTGFTDEAGDCVAATAEKDGAKLIAVICNSEDPGRWNDAKKLFDYGFNNYSFKTVVKNGDEVCSAPLTQQKSSEGDSLVLVAKEDINLYRPNEDFDSMTTELNITAENAVENKDTGEKMLKAPVEADQLVGTVTFKTKDGEVLASTDVYASRSVEKANIFARIFYKIRDGFKNIFSLKGLITVVVIIVIIILIILIIKLIRVRSNSLYRTGGYKYKINKRNKFK